MRCPTLALTALLVCFSMVGCSSAESSGGVSSTTPDSTETSVGSPATTVQSGGSTAPSVPSTVTAAASSALESAVVSTTPLGVVESRSDPTEPMRVDSGDMAYVSPGLFVFPDGHWRVVYVVGGVNYMTGEVSDTSIRMATCVDVRCASVETIELLATGPYRAVVGDHSQFAGNWVSFDADGTPYLLWNGVNDDATPPEWAFGIATCTDSTCDQLRTVELPLWTGSPGESEDYYYNTSLGVSPAGEVAITYFHANAPEDGGDSSVRIAYCDPSLACGDPAQGVVVFDVPGHTDEAGVFLWDWVPNHLTLGFGPAGLPALAYSWAFDGIGEWVVSCLDRGCSATTEPVLVAEHVQTGWPAQVLVLSDVGISGGILIAYESMGFDEPGEIGVSTCIDIGMGPICVLDEVSNESVIELSAWSYSPFAAAIGPDGLARIVSTTEMGFQLSHCTFTICSEVTTTPTGITAKALNLTTTESGESLVGLVDETGVHVARLP